MRGLGHLIVRLVAILAGLALAFLGTGLFLGFGFYGEYLAPQVAATDAAGAGLLAIVAGLIWSPFLAAAAFLPSLLVVFVCEWLRLRSLVANLAMGGLAALLTFWLHADLPAEAMRTTGPLVVVLAAGFIGGFCYWLVAGRSAGRWLEAEPAR